MANLPSTPHNQSNPPIRPPYIIVMDMNSCRLTTANQYQKFKTEAFMDEFESCKVMSNEDLAECFKTLSGLTVGQGQIRLKPQEKNKIKAFTQ